MVSVAPPAAMLDAASEEVSAADTRNLPEWVELPLGFHELAVLLHWLDLSASDQPALDGTLVSPSFEVVFHR